MCMLIFGGSGILANKKGQTRLTAGPKQKNVSNNCERARSLPVKGVKHGRMCGSTKIRDVLRDQASFVEGN